MENFVESDSAVNTAIVIFGVTGDLTRRKLIPALYEMAVADRLPDKFHIIGFARRDWNDALLVENMRASVVEYARSQPIDQAVLLRLTDSMRYISSTFDDPDGYRQLVQLLKNIEARNRLFYLAAPPEDYSTIIQSLGEVGLNHLDTGWTRIVIEKPYGRDLDSARELDVEVHRVFPEDQVYRIDHYLGKETVQNIVVFRFANGIFEPLWNRTNVDHVQITVAETVGVGSRADYYEHSGVIRDMFQNHMLQLLALTAMEAPVAFTANCMRDEKQKILRSLRPLRGEEALAQTVRAQYISGPVDGKDVPGYRDEPGVSPEFVTETYLAARLFVDNWRWAGVPFYLRSGKRLAKRVSEISIHFKQVPLPLFEWHNHAGEAPNILTIKIQPDEGINLSFGAKAPGPINQISPVKMSFDYVNSFGGIPPDAYERLLLDCIMGDATLFTRSDEVDAAWSFTTGILQAWQSAAVKNLPVYQAGTWGPPEAEEFARHGGDHSWHND